jgi:hypothetical protein
MAIHLPYTGKTFGLICSPYLLALILGIFRKFLCFNAFPHLPFSSLILHSKTPIIWDEWIGEAKGTYLDWHPIIEIWRGTQNLFDATQQGFEGKSFSFPPSCKFISYHTVINAYGWYLNPAPEGCTTWIDCYNHNPYYYLDRDTYRYSMIPGTFL